MPLNRESSKDWRSLAISICRWESNNKFDPIEIGWNFVLGSTGSRQGPIGTFCEHGDKRSTAIKEDNLLIVNITLTFAGNALYWIKLISQLNGQLMN
jgi:hypothetical protein